MSCIPEVLEKFSELSRKYDVTVHIAAHAADGNVHADILKEDMPLEDGTSGCYCCRMNSMNLSARSAANYPVSMVLATNDWT